MRSPSSILEYHGLNVCVLLNSYIKVLILNVMVFGSEAFGRQIVYEGGAQLNGISTLIRSGREMNCLTATWRYSKRASVCKPGREVSSGTKWADTMILDFPVCRQWEINLFKPPIDGIFVTAANTDMEGERKGEAKMFLPISLDPCGASSCVPSVSPVPARQWGWLIVFNFLAMTWRMDFINTASSFWPFRQGMLVVS